MHWFDLLQLVKWGPTRLSAASGGRGGGRWGCCRSEGASREVGGICSTACQSGLGPLSRLPAETGGGGGVGDGSETGLPV